MQNKSFGFRANVRYFKYRDRKKHGAPGKAFRFGMIFVPSSKGTDTYW